MLHPSHYDPLQPRVPKGHEGGGQWTREGDHAVRTASLAPVAGLLAVPGAPIVIAAGSLGAIAYFMWLSMHNSRDRRAVIEFRAREYGPTKEKAEEKTLDVGNVVLAEAARVANACKMFGVVQSMTNLAASDLQAALEGTKTKMGPAAYGSRVHAKVKAMVDGLGKPYLRAEVSYEKMKEDGVYGRKGSDVAPNFYPVATRVWRFASSSEVGATGQGAEPLRSAAPWPVAVNCAA